VKKIMAGIVSSVVLSMTSIAGGDIQSSSESVDFHNGPYIGIAAGSLWGIGRINFKEDGVSFHPKGTHHPHGFSGGIFVGYDWLLENNFIVGVEGSWNHVSAKDSVFDLEENGIITPDRETRLKQKWDASLRLRTGYNLGDWIPYVTGGISWARVTTRGIEPSTDFLFFDHSDTLIGWTLGTGLEWRINPQIYARLQYRYTDYRTKKFSTPDLGDPTYIIHTDIHYKTHILNLGISWRF